MSPPLICIRFDHLARATIRAQGPASLVRTVARLGAELRLTGEPPVAEARTTTAGSLRAWSVVDAAAWSEDAFDLVSLDEQVSRRAAAARGAEPPVQILIRAARRPPGQRLTGRRLLGVTRQVLTRYQRFLRARNAASAVPAFDRALALHERGDAGSKRACEPANDVTPHGLADECRPLAEADALSFFSLHAAGFLRYYGAEHTTREVADSLRRLGPSGRRELRRLEVPGTIHTMLARLELNELGPPNETDDMHQTDHMSKTNDFDGMKAARRVISSSPPIATGDVSRMTGAGATAEGRPS